MCGRAWKTARRDGVGNASRGDCPSSSTKRSLADAVVEVADRMAVVVVAGPRAARPLQRRLPQPLVAGAAQVVAGARIGELADLVEDLLAGLVGEVLAEAQVLGDLADQLPVGAGLSRRAGSTAAAG